MLNLHRNRWTDVFESSLTILGKMFHFLTTKGEENGVHDIRMSSRRMKRGWSDVAVIVVRLSQCHAALNEAAVQAISSWFDIISHQSESTSLAMKHFQHLLFFCLWLLLSLKKSSYYLFFFLFLFFKLINIRQSVFRLWIFNTGRPETLISVAEIYSGKKGTDIRKKKTWKLEA